MLDLKFSKQRFKDHFYYSKSLYVIFIIVALVTFSFVYAITRPIVPKEFRIDINVLGSSVEEEEMNIWEQEILAVLSSDQQEVNLNSMGISITGDDASDYTAYEILATRMAAKEGDLYILPKEMYLNLANQGAFIALDDIVSKYEYDSELNIDEYKVLIDDEDLTDGKSHTYGIPVDGVSGLINLGFNPYDKVIVVMIYTENYENALKSLDFIMNKTESITNDDFEAVDGQ